MSKVTTCDWLCPYPWTTLQIMNSAGDTYPCCWSTTSFGNIENQNVEEIWNGLVARRFRRDLALGYYHRHCNPNCPNLRRGGAPAAEELINNSAQRKDLVGENARIALQALYEGATDIRSSPIHLRVFPTNSCGIKCEMCSIWALRPKLDFGFHNKLFPLLDDVAVVEGTGGEPLLSRQFLDFLSGALHDYPHLKFAMITNGLRVTEALERPGFPGPERWEWIGLSIDSLSADTLSEIRHGIDATKLALALDELVSWSKGLCRIAVLTVIMRKNVHEIERIAEHVGKLARENANLRMSISLVHGNWPGLSDFSPEELLTIIELCRRLKDKFPFIFNTDVVEALANLTMSQSSLGIDCGGNSRATATEKYLGSAPRKLDQLTC